MMQVKITKNGEVTNGPIPMPDQATVDAWVASQEKDFAFGRPAGWYRLQDGADSSASSFITYDKRWIILLEDINRFEVQYDSETSQPQTWAKCKSEYRVVVKDISADADEIRELKRKLKDRVEQRAYRRLYRDYSMLEILAVLTSPIVDASLVAEINVAVQEATAAIAADMTAIRACTTLDQLEALKVTL